MDFVLTLHSHLPYVLNHGRWPHGSDWITEAAIDTYLPLIDALHGLDAEGVTAPVTVGFTPVLANQLASDAFRGELERYFEQRLTHCDEAPASLAQTGDTHLIPLVDYWRDRLTRLRSLFRSIDGDIVGVFRDLEHRGRLEVIGSADTRVPAAAFARREHPASARRWPARAPAALRAPAARMLGAGVCLPPAGTVEAAA